MPDTQPTSIDEPIPDTVRMVQTNLDARAELEAETKEDRS
jgi:hypothetical protein